MSTDSRLVLEFDQGQMTFRHINQSASYAQLLDLAEAINSFQDDVATRVLLVSTQKF